MQISNPLLRSNLHIARKKGILAFLELPQLLINMLSALMKTSLDHLETISQLHPEHLDVLR